MTRKKFYEVDKSTYLFSEITLQNGKRETPEEAVRQWCAFELLRAYSVQIGDIEFERRVRVGSKFYRIDILVKRDNQPWIIVECKEPSYSKHAAAMEQVISYANAQEIQAEFVVYTNGQVWNVQRRFKNQWIAIPDLPPPPLEEAEQSLDSLLSTIHETSPLLYKLNEPLEGKDAHKFFCAMQRFFCGWNLLTEGGNENLHFATDNLLRVLSVDKNDRPYTYGKLEASRTSFERFRELAGFSFPIYPVNGNHLLESEVQQIHNAVVRMAEATNGLTVYDSLLLRLNVAILEYARSWSAPKKTYPPIASNLHHALREFLSYTFAYRLNVSLPDIIDNISNGDLKRYCEHAWTELKL